MHGSKDSVELRQVFHCRLPEDIGCGFHSPGISPLSLPQSTMAGNVGGLKRSKEVLLINRSIKIYCLNRANKDKGIKEL